MNLRPRSHAATTIHKEPVFQKSLFHAGWQSSKDWKNGDATYAGMVEVSRALMKVDTVLHASQLSTAWCGQHVLQPGCQVVELKIA